jgi:GxxExxY protein
MQVNHLLQVEVSNYFNFTQRRKERNVYNMTENEISKILIEILLKIHRSLGPGLLESVYEETICYELSLLQIPFTRQHGIAVNYNDVKMDLGFRADIIVDNKVIIELKSIEALAPVHFKQLLTYLRLTNLKLGLLINFNVALIKDGIHRVVNNL